ncbi:hypothetical protein ACFXG4_37755 [Nocardia sp. NPDC059246]|uniref:hypothetical protein n=1 Tax=unclassified Nocardia TaxID=2637762 RepID=UPI0036A86334
MSEIDEIARDTGRTFRDVLTVAGQWLRTLRSADGASGRLTRKQRRELGEQIMAQVKAERVTAAWYTKRVADYRTEHAVAQFRRECDPLYTDRDAHADAERLDAMRLRIEESLTTAPLRIEHRGQVVMALDKAGRHPYQLNPSFETVFPTMNTRQMQEARAAAVESEQWVQARAQELDQRVASMTVHQPASRVTTSDQTGVHPESAAPLPSSLFEQEVAMDQDVARVNAVQAIRHAQYTHLRAQASGRADHRTEAARRAAAAQAAQAGMTVEQVRWEFANAETNSRCQVTVASSSPDGGQQVMRSYHPSEADAAAWTRDAVHTNTWKAGTTLSVRAREIGRRHPFYVAEGNQIEVGHSTHDWQREITREQTEPPDYDRTREKPPTAGESDDLQRRVLLLQRGLDAVVAERDQHKQQLDSVRADLEALKNTQLRTNHELKETRNRLLSAVDDRNRYRGERDEAVRKLAQSTPQRDRYGSRERVAAEQDRRGNTTAAHSAAPTAEPTQEQSDPAKRYSVYVGRLDDIELMREHGVSRPNDLPEAIRPVSGEFDSEHDAHEWARRRVAAMDTGGMDIEVGIVDRHLETGSRIRNHTRGSRDDVLGDVDGWLDGRNNRHRNPAQAARDTTSPPTTGTGQQRPPIQRER